MIEQPISTPDLSKQASAAELGPQARLVHRAILTNCAKSGRMPSPAELREVADAHGLDLRPAIAELIAGDLIRTDRQGELLVAYPFSALPTAHRVTPTGGPAVYAMCAIDALGMSAMLGQPVVITSSEPDTGKRIVVRVDGGRAQWDPLTAVVYAGTTSDCCAPSADRTCGHINFFTSRATARDWADRHPDLTGLVIDQPAALDYGIAEFGALLRDATRREPTTAKESRIWT